MDKNQLQSTIDSLFTKAWNAYGDEQNARLHELAMFYEQLLPLGEDPYFVLEHLARIYMRLKEFGKAKERLKKMLEISPQSSVACSLMSEVLYELGEYEKALEIFDQGNPEIFSAFRYDFRAKINRALGRTQDADKDQKIYDDYQAAEQAKWDDPNHYYHYK